MAPITNKIANKPTRTLITETLTPRSRRLAIAVAATPAILVVLLIATYFAAPAFFLRVILAAQEREQQVVEGVTFACALIASLCLFGSALRMLPLRKHAIVGPGVFFITIAALAAFFFAGEEISWGQSLAGKKLFESSLLDPNRETNLHNATELPIQSLGSLFLALYFIAMPIAWKFRHRLPLPKNWAPAIPEWPIVVGMITAFAWGKFNDLYRVFNQDAITQTFYIEFVEQVNEHKEMLIAVVLCAYGFYRIAWTRRAADLVAQQIEKNPQH